MKFNWTKTKRENEQKEITTTTFKFKTKQNQPTKQTFNKILWLWYKLKYNDDIENAEKWKMKSNKEANKNTKLGV